MAAMYPMRKPSKRHYHPTMSTVLDNIENQFSAGLKRDLVRARRLYCCVGHFNLRSRGLVCGKNEKLTGDQVAESGKTVIRHCRLLRGMTRTPKDEVKDGLHQRAELMIDMKSADRHRKQLAIKKECNTINLSFFEYAHKEFFNLAISPGSCTESLGGEN